MKQYIFSGLLILGVTASLIALILLGLNIVFHSHLSMDSADKDMRLLFSKVGGVEEICKEAGEIFIRFGNTDQRPLSKLELNDYPAIAALGKVDGIWPRTPPIIKIRVGNHWDGYIIEIVDTRDPHPYNQFAPNVKIGNCIYVHR